MSAACYPITVMPHVSALYQRYLAQGTEHDARLGAWYGAELSAGPFAGGWVGRASSGSNRDRLADALAAQTRSYGGNSASLANIERLRRGARAIVTGQQVGLLGGPLLVLLKAATAVARAEEATARSGVEHVPLFWLATEDHDLPEVDQVSLLTKTRLELRSAGLRPTGGPVGAIALGAEVGPVLDWAEERLGYAPFAEVLRRCYAAEGATLGSAFARLMSEVFAEQGLIVMDASSREFHALGASSLRFAIEHAEDLEQRLIGRSAALEAAGFHAQVMVAGEMSLLFLVSDGGHGAVRQALRRTADGQWKAGRQTLSTEELLGILDATPERISPNALLRPVFQDTILPTAAYVGGPAEVAYWAQSSVVYEAALGRVTPVLPRLSATLIEPQVGAVMAQHEVQLPDAMTTAETLALRLGERAMPIELKRRLASAGNALEAELGALIAYVSAMDDSLGRSAETSGSKMRYQMNRLRRIAARHELEREGSLAKHAGAIALNVFPDGHPQERVVAGAWYLARYEGLVARLVTEAKGMCGGHAVIRL